MSDAIIRRIIVGTMKARRMDGMQSQGRCLISNQLQLRKVATKDMIKRVVNGTVPFLHPGIVRTFL